MKVSLEKSKPLGTADDFYIFFNIDKETEL